MGSNGRHGRRNAKRTHSWGWAGCESDRLY
jgi:hypothetical protein